MAASLLLHAGFNLSTPWVGSIRSCSKVNAILMRDVSPLAASLWPRLVLTLISCEKLACSDKMNHMARRLACPHIANHLVHAPRMKPVLLCGGTTLMTINSAHSSARAIVDLVLTAPIYSGAPTRGEKHRPMASISIGSPTGVPVP